MSANVAERVPEHVWAARALRDIDARGRSELAGEMRVVRLVAGEVLYRQGEPAHAVFVLARG